MFHFQVYYNWKIRFSYNDYHKKLNHGLFAIYNFDLFTKKS